MTKRYQIEVRLTPTEQLRFGLPKQQFYYVHNVSAASPQLAIQKIRELGYQGSINYIEEVCLPKQTKL